MIQCGCNAGNDQRDAPCIQLVDPQPSLLLAPFERRRSEIAAHTNVLRAFAVLPHLLWHEGGKRAKWSPSMSESIFYCHPIKLFSKWLIIIFYSMRAFSSTTRRLQLSRPALGASDKNAFSTFVEMLVLQRERKQKTM